MYSVKAIAALSCLLLANVVTAFAPTHPSTFGVNHASLKMSAVAEESVSKKSGTAIENIR
jgi:hypothetical protein